MSVGVSCRIQCSYLLNGFAVVAVVVVAFSLRTAFRRRRRKLSADYDGRNSIEFSPFGLELGSAKAPN